VILFVRDENGNWIQIPALVGAKGEKGEKGDTGAKGDAGLTPVKGVDYYTAADREQLVSEVMTAVKGADDFAAAVAEKIVVATVAAPPEYVNDISECVDTGKIYVLPNGHLCAYMTRTTVTEGETIPNFTNIFDPANGAAIHDGYRYSSSGGGFVEYANNCAIVVPVNVVEGETVVIRAREVTNENAPYAQGNYCYFSTDGTTFGDDGLYETSYAFADGELTYSFRSTIAYKYCVFNVAPGVDADSLIVTQDEEISYTIVEGGNETVTGWMDTGIEYNQPPDYSQRVSALESKTAQLRTDVSALENKVSSCAASGGMDAFAFAAYPPSPQLPGDGSEGADFNVADVPTEQVYAYMDALWERYRTYMVRQNLGKDASGEYDYYRYVYSKAYWRAWYKEGYPKMYAWANGDTVVYSESVSPRIGDMMYSTAYIGTEYGAVTAVNCETVGEASTRVAGGLVFERYPDGDTAPEIVYTAPFAIMKSYMGRTYTAGFVASHGVKEFTHEYIVDSQGVKFWRYPFEDKKLDGTRLFSVFILANEHGNHGDSMMPSVIVMRLVKDLCGATNNLFLQWLRENAVVTVIPVGNPYGTYRNANGVNINRNYDTPGWAGSDADPQGGTRENGQFGAYAGSEIETQYIMNTIRQCKAQAAISCHGRGVAASAAGEYNTSVMFQGCGFDAERMWRVEEALFSMYNFGFDPLWHTIEDQTADNYLNAGKSPSYIEYAGAVGGLIEMDDNEAGTLDAFTPLAMEQAYAELLLTLQNWVQEALERAGEDA